MNNKNNTFHIQVMLKRWYRSRVNVLFIITLGTVILYLLVVYFVLNYYLLWKKAKIYEVTEKEVQMVIFNNESMIAAHIDTASSQYIIPKYNLSDRASIKRYLNKKLKHTFNLEKESGCMPELYQPTEILYKTLPKFVCSDLDWVKCYKSECRVVKEILDTTDNITCIYVEMSYQINGVVPIGKRITVYNNDTYTLTNSDFVTVKCKGFSLYGQFKSYWSGTAIGIRDIVTTEDTLERTGLANILLLGFGCGTRNYFFRKMPKTYNALVEKLNYTVLRGFNSLGEDYASTLLPMLTGESELELPDVRTRVQPFKSMRASWFLFRKLEKYGYRTAYFEDTPWSIFPRLNPFSSRPAHHYLRPYLLHEKRIKNVNCIGDVTLYEMIMNLTYQVLSSPKSMTFAFLERACRQNTTIADDAVEKLLTKILDEKMKTVVILFGAKNRIPNKKPTNQRAPFAAIFLPPSLNNLTTFKMAVKENSNALTTPYDIYTTIMHVTNLFEFMPDYRIDEYTNYRALSLFDNIPSERTCSDAGIQAEFCTCYIWDDVTKVDNLYMTLPNSLVDFINKRTSSVRSKCAKYVLFSINWMKRLRSNLKLISYNGSVDLDGYISKFNPNAKVDKEYYRMKVTLNPKISFHAFVTYNNKNGKVIINGKKIVKITVSNSSCVMKKRPELIKYCYCT